MDYNKFINILNKRIFQESKADLVRKFAEHPHRYIGLFRPTKPKGKIIQNLTQSAEIKFGDAFEEILEIYFNDFDYTTLPRIYKTDGRKKYCLDQLFEKKDKIVFIEQKVRDDHDSTKKKGQIDNFIRKIDILQSEYPNKIIEANFYFIDDCLKKNRKYYQEEIDKITKDYGLDCFLFYGEKLFERYQIDTWSEILKYLKNWKKSIPDMPEINFDIDADNSFQEISKLETLVFRKILNNDEIFKKMILTISPEKKLLFLLLDFFKKEHKKTNKKIYDTLYGLLKNKLKIK
ncbi:MAG: restriction endonuclease [Gammaproteobacteria bacterium]|nr:MAG: restriction endonuclease [Gammaproteobacteria bacterium]